VPWATGEGGQIFLSFDWLQLQRTVAKCKKYYTKPNVRTAKGRFERLCPVKALTLAVFRREGRASRTLLLYGCSSSRNIRVLSCSSSADFVTRYQNFLVSATKTPESFCLDRSKTKTNDGIGNPLSPRTRRLPPPQLQNRKMSLCPVR
jgi:hypothetical protein